MSILNLKSSWNSATGFLAILVFFLFTITSLALYPGHYNPFNNWVSDLGNANLNPLGPIFFNWGCIVTGLILVTFFSGLHRWQPHKKCNRILLVLGVIIGVVSSISLIFVGIFPETDIKMHQIASISVFSSIFFCDNPFKPGTFQTSKVHTGCGLLRTLRDYRRTSLPARFNNEKLHLSI